MTGEGMGVQRWAQGDSCFLTASRPTPTILPLMSPSVRY